MTGINPKPQAEADRVFPTKDRIDAYDRLQRTLIPGWRLEFRKATQSMWRAHAAASDPNGSLRDLATFILAAKASENAQVSLLAAEKIAREMHPMKWGT